MTKEKNNMERTAVNKTQATPILSAEEIRAAQAKDVLTSAEVCALYGLSDDQLCRYRRQRCFRFYRLVGKNNYRYRKSDIEDFIFACEVESSEQQKAKSNLYNLIKKGQRQ